MKVKTTWEVRWRNRSGFEWVIYILATTNRSARREARAHIGEGRVKILSCEELTGDD